jgi:cytochrome c oxidase subunit 4
MSAQQASNSGGHDDSHHLIPLASYFKVFAVLITLTVVTVAAAQVNFGPWNTIIAFAIATVKATLVAAIFMHLKYDDKLNRVIIVAAVFFLIVLWFFCITDEVTRVIEHSIL